MDLPNRPSRTASATAHRFAPLTLFILTGFTFALSVSSVALVLDNIVYVKRQRQESDYFYVEFSDGVRAIIEYFPQNLRLETTHVLLAAGIVSVLGCLVVGVGLLVNRKVTKMDGKPSQTLPNTFALASLTFLATLICTLHSRSLFRASPAGGPLLNSDYLDAPPTNGWGDDSWISQYQSPYGLNLVDWNCALAGITGYVYPAGDLRRMCREGVAMFDLMIPVMVLQALSVGVLGWMVWRERKVAKAAVSEVSQVGR